MNRASALIVAGALALALIAGTASRALTLRSTTAAAPVRIVLQAQQQASPTPPFVERD